MLTNRSDLPKVLESKTIVRFQDCDPFGHLNNARYIDYFMNARTDHLRENYDFEIFAWGKETGESWVVTKTKIAYLWPAGISEEVVIRTRLIHFDTSLLRVEAIMLDAAGGRVKAVGWVEFAYISMASGRPVRHGEELTNFFSAVVADDVDANQSFDDRVNEAKSEFRKKPVEEMQPTP